MLPAGSVAVVSFKAGKMAYDGKVLQPDSRKGTVRILRVGLVRGARRLISGRADRSTSPHSGGIHPSTTPLDRCARSATPSWPHGSVPMQTEDGLTHLMWYERTDAGCKAEPENDVIVFPEEATFQKVQRARRGHIFRV